MMMMPFFYPTSSVLPARRDRDNASGLQSPARAHVREHADAFVMQNRDIEARAGHSDNPTVSTHRFNWKIPLLTVTGVTFIALLALAFTTDFNKKP